MGPWSVISQNFIISDLNFAESIFLFDVTAMSSVATATTVAYKTVPMFGMSRLIGL